MSIKLNGELTPREHDINQRLIDLGFYGSRYEPIKEYLQLEGNNVLRDIDRERISLTAELQEIARQRSLELGMQKEDQDNPLDFTDGKLENGTQNFLWQIQHARLSSEIWEM